VIAYLEVVAFYDDHGLDVTDAARNPDTARRLLAALRDHEQELLSRDPLRIRVTVRRDEERLRLTLDESLAVVEAERT
jgi:hypothetical protein